MCEKIGSSDNSPLYPYEECESIFLDLDSIEKHLENDHSQYDQPDLHENEHLDKISQFDGPCDELYVFETLPNTSTSIRTANYAFNQKKQTDNIIKDASINDYEVTVNNDDQNATVKCSTGFYLQVGRASVGNLKNPSVLACGNIAITVDDIKTTEDQRGTEGTKLIYFSFKSDQNQLGGVTVHLHHSTRTIQIQGSSMMPDSSRAALWFLKNFILVRFKEQAKAKNFAIKLTNNAVLSSVSTKESNPTSASSPACNSCYSCYKRFDTKSKPSRCDNCENFFHKTSCLREHSKLCHSNTRSRTPLPPPTAQHPPMPADVATQPISGASILLSRPTITVVPPRAASTSTVSIPNDRTISSLSNDALIFTPSPSTTTPSSNTTSQPTAGSAPSNSSQHSSLPVTAIGGPVPSNRRSTTRKNSKPFVPTTAEQARINFLQTELAAAQTRIVQLDANVQDKDQRITVLMARIKIFEDEQTRVLHEKYFPSEERYQNTPKSQHQSSQPPPATSRKDPPVPQCSANHSPPSCCHQPLCCQHCSYRSHYRENEQPSHNDPNIESSIAGLQAQVTLLSEDTKSLHVALLKIQEHCNQSRVPSAPPQESAENMRDTNETNSAHASDDSVVSMEEFIDGDDKASQVPLNFQLTNQQ